MSARTTLERGSLADGMVRVRRRGLGSAWASGGTGGECSSHTDWVLEWLVIVMVLS